MDHGAVAKLSSMNRHRSFWSSRHGRQNPSDWSQDWEDGHYVVGIGYDSNNIYFMDPATMGNYTYIPVDEFLARWHDKDQRGKKTE